jgi:5-methylthioadenosine/S-adenosylhomocysteine deaminase
MRALEVFDMATRHGAQALQWFDDIGSLEVGKKADLVALDLDTPINLVPQKDRLDPEAIASSIVYSSQSTHVQWTMVDGKLVYQKGKSSLLTKPDFIQRVHRAQAKVRKAVLTA